MSDDASYTAFLEKANQPTGYTAPQRSAPATTSSDNVPPALRSLSARTYTSDTDSPFIPFHLPLPSGGSKLSPQDFERLVSSTSTSTSGSSSAGPAEVEEMSVEEWDPRGEYADVVEKVRSVVDGDLVKVYRIQREGARCEYWVVGGRWRDGVVGVKVEAVES